MTQKLQMENGTNANPQLQTERCWLLLDAGAGWAWIAVMPPANGFRDVVERRSLGTFRLAMEPREMEGVVVAL
jgi:hypothetical protein